MDKPKQRRAIFLRLDDDDLVRLDAARERMAAELDVRLSRTAAVRRLLRLGLNTEAARR
jgi:hypothetical protein